MKLSERLRYNPPIVIDKKEQELIEAVKIARAHGDLSENAEYHAARESLALYRSRKQANEAALAEEERQKKKLKEDRESAVQELLDTGMSLDDIKATMPWMLK